MRTRNRFLRVFAAALSAVVALAGLTSTPAGAASITYTDPICSRFYTAPGVSPGDVVLRCVAMSCSIATSSSYIVPIGTAIQLTASCATPANGGYTWAIAARSPQGCPAPSAASGPQVSVMSNSAMTCWYDVVASDGSGNQGIARYGVVWTSVPAGCSATATPTALPSSSGNVALSVTCAAGNPTSASWTRNGSPIAASGLNSGDTPPANSTSSPAQYTYAASACNSAGCGAPVNAPVVTVAGVPPSQCSITPTPNPPSLPSAGGAVSMSVNCANGGPFTQYNWRKNSQAFGTSNATLNDNLPANAAASPVQYTYDVQVCNAAGCTAVAVASVTFTVAGTVASAGYCGQYSDVTIADIGWPDTVVTTNVGTPNPGMRPDSIFVFKITVPSTATMPLNQGGYMSGVEWQDPPGSRIVSLSSQACDFRGLTIGFAPPVDVTGTNYPMAWSWGLNPIIYYQLPDGSLNTNPAFGTYYPRLQPGQVYYISIMTKDIGSGQTGCTGSPNCNMRWSNNVPR